MTGRQQPWEAIWSLITAYFPCEASNPQKLTDSSVNPHDGAEKPVFMEGGSLTGIFPV